MENSIYYHLRIVKLFCYTSDEDDSDEVFLKLDGKKIWPKGKFTKMNDAEEEIGIEIKVEKGAKFEVEVWDYDFWTPNDKLGHITLEADKMGGPYKTDFIKTDKGNSHYALEWEVM